MASIHPYLTFTTTTIAEYNYACQIAVTLIVKLYI